VVGYKLQFPGFSLLISFSQVSVEEVIGRVKRLQPPLENQGEQEGQAAYSIQVRAKASARLPSTRVLKFTLKIMLRPSRPF
jgi:hypothetical protein